MNWDVIVGLGMPGVGAVLLLVHKLTKIDTKLGTVEIRLTSVETALMSVETRLTTVETHLTNVDARLTSVEKYLYKHRRRKHR